MLVADDQASSKYQSLAQIALGDLAGIVGIEIDEAALDLPVADLEHVAPAPAPCSGAPWTVAMLAVACPFARQDVAATEDPIEVGVVVHDRFERAAECRLAMSH